MMDTAQMLQQLTETEERSKSNKHRIDKLEKRQDDLDGIVKAVAVMKNDQEYIKDSVSKIENKVDEMAAKPARRWDGLVEAIVTVLIGAVCGFVLSKIGF